VQGKGLERRAHAWSIYHWRVPARQSVNLQQKYSKRSQVTADRAFGGPPRSGRLYQDGAGVAPDASKARDWYEKAAKPSDSEKPVEKPNSDAMFKLGALYGRKQDYASAQIFYRMAANADHAGAMVDLGKLHEDGRGVLPDNDMARDLYEQAPAMDSAEAMLKLAAALRQRRVGGAGPRPGARVVRRVAFEDSRNIVPLERRAFRRSRGRTGGACLKPLPGRRRGLNARPPGRA
jgi:TPR repeat protein